MLVVLSSFHLVGSCKTQDSELWHRNPFLNSQIFFFFLKGFCSTHCCSTEVFNCHCDDLLIFKEVVEANVFQVQPMDKVRYSLTISSNHNQLAPENMFYLALSQPLCLQVICTPTEKSW